MTPSRPHTRLNSSSGQVHSMGQLSDRQSDQRPLIVSPVVSFTWVAHQANPFTDWSIVHLVCSTPPKVKGNTQGSSDTVRHSEKSCHFVKICPLKLSFVQPTWFWSQRCCCCSCSCGCGGCCCLSSPPQPCSSVTLRFPPSSLTRLWSEFKRAPLGLREPNHDQSCEKRACTWPHSICACAAAAVK